MISTVSLAMSFNSSILFKYKLLSFFTILKKINRIEIINIARKIIKKLDLDEKCRPQNLDPLTFYKISKEYEVEKI